jgi:hypothetical protein
MEVHDVNFNMKSLNLDQRYFHFIALRDISGYKLSDYWNQLGNIRTKKSPYIYEQDFEIQHRQLESDYPYTRGQLLEAVSVSGDGSPPYLYDVFALKVKVVNQTYLVFAFPFVTLAREMINNLLYKHNLRKKGDIQKVDVPLLVKKGDTELGSDSFHSHIVGLKVVIADDPDLSNLSLEGDNPLKSMLYQKFLQDPIQQGDYTPERCVLACELQWPSENSNQTIVSNVKKRKIRSKMHMDLFGNFKFYVHKGGENFITIPYLLQILFELNCLNNVSMNPLSRISEQEES